MKKTLPVKVHPIADIFPMMSDDEFAGLKADIEANGVRECVVFWNEQLVDGRNRMAAMIDLGLDWNDYASELDPDTDPVTFVISHNLHRRHLDPSQRAVVANKVRGVFDEQAKGRMSKGGGDKKSADARSGVEIIPPPVEGKKSRDAAGELMGVSGRLVDQAKKVLESGNEELISKVEAGEVSVSAAAKQLKQDQDGAGAIMDRMKNPPKPQQAPVWSTIAKKIESAELLFGDNAQQVRQAEKVKRKFTELVEAYDAYVNEVES
jgi:hypothetical protein